MDREALKSELIRDEEWRQIVGFADYEISNYGRVRSCRPRKGSRARINGGIIKGWSRKRNGAVMCMFVSLRKESVTHCFRIHRLVLEAFVGSCPDGMEGCHFDGDPTNNRISNLRWDTHIANVSDCIRHGRKVAPPLHIGDCHPRAKLTMQAAYIIRSSPRKRGVQSALARRFGVSLTTIKRVWDRETWIARS